MRPDLVNVKTLWERIRVRCLLPTSIHLSIRNARRVCVRAHRPSRVAVLLQAVPRYAADLITRSGYARQAADQQMKIVLGGGGSATAEAEVLAHFASLVQGGRILNLSWAQPDPGDPRIHEWVEHTLCPLGIREVTTVSDVRAVRFDETVDGVFIGGGNTFHLMARLRVTGVAAALVERARAGLPCYGGSAGAIVFGAHIGTGDHSTRMTSA